MTWAGRGRPERQAEVMGRKCKSHRLCNPYGKKTGHNNDDRYLWGSLLGWLF